MGFNPVYNTYCGSLILAVKNVVFAVLKVFLSFSTNKNPLFANFPSPFNSPDSQLSNRILHFTNICEIILHFPQFVTLLHTILHFPTQSQHPIRQLSTSRHSAPPQQADKNSLGTRKATQVTVCLCNLDRIAPRAFLDLIAICLFVLFLAV